MRSFPVILMRLSAAAPKSPAYNTITTVKRAGRRVSGEHMRNFPQYRHGLFIDYPLSHARPAGPCIFIHNWSAPGEATAGCISMPARKAESLQDFSQGGAVLAVLPRQAPGRFRGCLPPQAVN